MKSFDKGCSIFLMVILICINMIRKNLADPSTHKKVTLIQLRLLQMMSYQLLISFIVSTK